MKNNTNRTIKFRVWDKTLARYIPYNSFLAFDNPEYVFEQFSGMKDRKGNEVYEGDIVCGHIDSEDAALGNSANVGRVFFAAGSFMINGDGCLYEHTFSASPDILEDYLVIGNCLENPEFLK